MEVKVVALLPARSLSALSSEEIDVKAAVDTQEPVIVEDR